MSDMKQERSTTEVPPQTRGQEGTSGMPAPARPSEPVREPAMSGWMMFASTMLVMAGAFHLIAGLTALFKSGYYVVASEALLVSVDFTAWGWTHIGIGALAAAAGIALLFGQAWARVVGVTLAVISAVVSLAFLAALPIMVTAVIALDVLVIYAITVHGKEEMA